MIQRSDFEHIKQYEKLKKDARYRRVEQMPYRYESIEKLLENTHEIRRMFEDFTKVKRPRLDRLDDYYMAENTDIYARTQRTDIDETLSDHRVSHAFAPYISSFITSYTVGNPPTIEHDDESLADLIRTFDDLNDINAHNYEVCTDSSIYGEGFELMYRNHDDKDMVVLVPKLNAFIIYDDTLQKNEIGSVIIRQVVRDGETKTILTLYSDRFIYESMPLEDTESDKVVFGEPRPHPYGEQPLNSFKNNRFGIGDYERVIPQIDAYDNAQSDTANYMTDLTDAILAISGAVNPDLDVQEVISLKKARLMILEDSVDAYGKFHPSKAEYIYKQYDVAGVEAYKKRLENDIHKLSYTPNFSEENIGGSSSLSGEALSYRLVGLNQVRKIKETFFSRGFIKRYRMLARANQLEIGSALKITYHPNLPKAVLEELKSYTAAGGRLSTGTMLSLLSFVEDPDQELEAIQEEEERTLIGNYEDNFGFEGITENTATFATAEDTDEE